jgi:transposase InsO family protein
VTLRLPFDVSLPSNWQDDVKLGFLRAVALAHRAITIVDAWCLNSRIPRVRAAADFARLETELALLREEVRIKDARMATIPASRRPLYPPVERLAILALKAARAWSNAQTARAFLLTPPTIASWLHRAATEGSDALIQLPEPVNRFPDFVATLVQRLKVLCPVMGKVRIAQHLARSGLRLSASSVGRMLKRKVPPVTPSKKADDGLDKGKTTTDSTATGHEATPKKPPLVVNSDYPHHVWHVALSVVPTAVGFWVPWFPGALGQVWPFCHIVAVIVDHFSRKAITAGTFHKQPSGAAFTRLLDTSIAISGRAPKYIISDQGCQFREDYRDWCDARGVKPRFGAIGQHGSIAIVERFILSLKNECTRRIVVPLPTKAFETEVLLYLRWYNEHRPHQALAGRTPDEVCRGHQHARAGPKLETRARAPDQGKNSATTEASCRGSGLRLVVTHLEGRKHLPVVGLDVAA